MVAVISRRPCGELCGALLGPPRITARQHETAANNGRYAAEQCLPDKDFVLQNGQVQPVRNEPPCLWTINKWDPEARWRCR